MSKIYSMLRAMDTYQRRVAEPRRFDVALHVPDGSAKVGVYAAYTMSYVVRARDAQRAEQCARLRLWRDHEAEAEPLALVLAHTCHSWCHHR